MEYKKKLEDLEKQMRQNKRITNFYYTNELEIKLPLENSEFYSGLLFHFVLDNKYEIDIQASGIIDGYFYYLNDEGKFIEQRIKDKGNYNILYTELCNCIGKENLNNINFLYTNVYDEFAIKNDLKQHKAIVVLDSSNWFNLYVYNSVDATDLYDDAIDVGILDMLETKFYDNIIEFIDGYKD